MSCLYLLVKLRVSVFKQNALEIYVSKSWKSFWRISLTKLCTEIIFKWNFIRAFKSFIWLKKLFKLFCWKNHVFTFIYIFEIIFTFIRGMFAFKQAEWNQVDHFNKATHVNILLWWHFIVRANRERDHYLNCS